MVKTKETREPTLAIPRAMVPELLALIEKISRESAGTGAQVGDIVLVKESSSNIERN